jgi:GT2 family glycosyltransferase
MERLPVGVVVVNWNGGSLLDSCLDALVGQGASRVLVVDNGSEPDEVRRIAARDGVAILPLGTNRGFAAASNAGAVDARLKALPYLAFVNNDAVLEPGYLAACAAALEADPGLSAVQGVVLDAGGRLVDGLGIAWNGRYEAVQVGHGAPPPSDVAPPFAVSGVSGTAPVFRRSAFEGASGFAGSFFAWYEDADLSLRLLRAGGRFACVPSARARHVGSATGRRTPEVKWRLLFLNRARTLRRNLTGPARLRVLLHRPVPLPALRDAARDLGLPRTLRAIAGAAAGGLATGAEDREARRGRPLLPRLPG